MKCPRCQHANPSQARFCMACGAGISARAKDQKGGVRSKAVARQSSAHKKPAANLKKHLAAALKREAEAREQQAATSEILRVIGSSPGDLQPVFDIIAKRATALTGAVYGAVYLVEGESILLHAHFSDDIPNTDQFVAAFPMPITSDTLIARTLRTGTLAHIADMEAVSVPEAGRSLARTLGVRSTLTVPMRRDGRAIGAIGVNRRRPGDFSPAEIALLQTFADQAVIAIENVRLFTETKQALERQTATGEILRVISSSVNDLRPIFATILASAARLCSAHRGALLLFKDGLFETGAELGAPAGLSEARKGPYRPHPDTVIGRMLVERRAIYKADLLADPLYREGEPRTVAAADGGSRSLLAVPLLKDSAVIGAITIHRPEPGPFSDDHIALLQTFADQAVIAIENVRLFTELEARNAELTTALERQTATSEILRVISRAQQDAQAVFDTIVQSAVRLCRATTAAVFRVEDGVVYHPANYGGDPEALTAARARYPRPVDIQTMPGMIVLARSVVQIPDSEEVGLPDHVRQVGRILGFRSVVGVPMLREGEAVGALLVTRREPGRFSDPEVELLKTFSDQAVIAIENVRLFTELQEKNKALTDAHEQVSEALERQTATSEILRVISSSPTSVEAVFDTILANALRLCETPTGGVFTFDGRAFHLAAAAHWSDDFLAALREAAIVPGPETPLRRVGITLEVSHVDDIFGEPSFSPPAAYRLEGMRTSLAVPMLKEGRLIGALTFHRREVRPFTEAQIALIKIFADQAVIAIENVRLFKELEARTQDLTRSVGELRALGEVGRAVSSTLDLETVLTTIVSRAVELSGVDGGVVWEYDAGSEEFVRRASTATNVLFAEARRDIRVRKGEGVVGRTAITLEPAQVPDITVQGAIKSRMLDNLIESGIRAILAVPMVREGRVIGSLVVWRNNPGDFPAETIELLRTFATQSALAIQNARLFRELADKSRQLEAASQHKSEFLANMSHELRTPLNAVIGFSEVLSERMFGELNEKQDEYLKDIHASGQHLLSLINDILDLSKIEAGRMELELTEFDLPATIDNALTLVRERASRRGVTLHQAIDHRLGQIQGDERKTKQVLLNLLSNALKFTPEGGRIDVRGGLSDEVAEISVADTGVGIAPEDQEAIFEEFKQVGTAAKKIEGTGLGLALSRKFIELHGGRIWVKSQIGAGSTFTFTIPVRHGE